MRTKRSALVHQPSSSIRLTLVPTHAASIRSARGQRSLSSLGKAFLRPAITLYDESPPGSSAFEIGDLALADADPKRGADLMLVMGTSLRIPGFKALVKQFAKTVKARGGSCILVNRDEMTSKSEWKTVFDYEGELVLYPCQQVFLLTRELTQS